MAYDKPSTVHDTVKGTECNLFCAHSVPILCPANAKVYNEYGTSFVLNSGNRRQTIRLATEHIPRSPREAKMEQARASSLRLLDTCRPLLNAQHAAAIKSY